MRCPFNSAYKYYNHNEFQNKYNIKTNFVDFYVIVRATKSCINYETLQLVEVPQYPILPLNIQIFCDCRKGARDMYMYQILCCNKNVTLPTSALKWNTLFNINNEDWKHIYNIPYRIIKSTRLQWFQTRINHRILGTNWLLNKINIHSNPYCSFCKKEIEYIEHLF